MKFKNILYLIVVFSIIFQDCLTAKENELLFEPLAANIFESRLGAVFTNSDEKLRLDIGGNYDFWNQSVKEKSEISIGAEFFTFTRLRSEGRLKFPVETTDFFFGVNSSYSREFNKFTLESRLRLAHISTHLSDGFSQNSTFNKPPFVYSKEFFDLTIALRKGAFRPYLGATVNFSKQPKSLNAFVPQAGLEFERKIIKNIYLQLAFDFKLNGYDGTYLGMNTFMAGLEFKTAKNRGILLKSEYYSGQNYYGQFYNEKLNYFGMGFEFLFH